MIMLNKQKGYLVLVLVLLIVIVGFILVTLNYVLSEMSHATINELYESRAKYLAESGLEQGTLAITTPNFAIKSGCNALNINNSLSSGNYIVSASSQFNASPTTLSSPINSLTLTIPVNSTTNYATSGRILIDHEWITYQSIDGNNFYATQRGAAGSSAVSHAVNTPIGQYQCSITSTGGSPSLNQPDIMGGKMIFTAIVSLPVVWGIGGTGTLSGGASQWNLPTELAWQSTNISGSDLVDLSMTSYVDGWASGNVGNLFHFNGTNWTNTKVTPPVTYNGIFCNAYNDCYAVGNSYNSVTNCETGTGNCTTNDEGNTLSSILHWNGNSWTAQQLSDSGISDMTNLMSVSCASSQDCWAVGTKDKGTFYHYDGTSWSGINVSTLTGFPFNHVFCTPSSVCWAVGANAIFAIKSGGTWSNVNTGLPDTQYNSVYCNNNADCWAVGNVKNGLTIVHWNGTNWSLSNNQLSSLANLRAISCASPNDCWAAGNLIGSQPLVLHWDGNSWNQATNGNLPNVNITALAAINIGRPSLYSWKQKFS